MQLMFAGPHMGGRSPTMWRFHTGGRGPWEKPRWPRPEFAGDRAKAPEAGSGLWT